MFQTAPLQSKAMEDREDLDSILPFLPVVLQSSSLIWHPQVAEALKSMSKGPAHSHVDSGDVLFLAISDIRNSLSLFSEKLATSTADGYALFFDRLMTQEEARKWFCDVLPALANLLLRLPSLLEIHYHDADNRVSAHTSEVKTGLRLLDSQQPGVVFLSQELTGALLASALFCLFPTSSRRVKDLPAINFDKLFASLYKNYEQKQENKIKCIIHYFERICAHMPAGLVSFERKVLPLHDGFHDVSYPKVDIWRKSIAPLCRLEVCRSGLLEDHVDEALQVDFANRYIGGGALHMGCVQEEIRFMINPELVVGMLFLPSMAVNEAVEIVGAERFSNYTGYATSFRYSGDHMDNKGVDSLGRRKTRIVAIDALCFPGIRQYKLKCLLREINKAFCGFYDQSKYQDYQKLLRKSEISSTLCDQHADDPGCRSTEAVVPSTTSEAMDVVCGHLLIYNSLKDCQHPAYQDDIGIVTGNWGCGAFGGDPEIKTIIQWLAASHALRPFIVYYTFGAGALRNLNQVSQWIVSQGWTVGELWNLLVEYSSQRYNGAIHLGFFAWLLPSLSRDFALLRDIPPTP